MKVYGNPVSPPTRMVMITLAEKNQEAEYVHLDFGKGATRSPEHLARNPFGHVPVLEDEGFTLYEGRAIIRYLDDRLPGSPPAPLTPGDIRARALMNQFMSIEQAALSPNVMTLVYSAFRSFGPGAVEKAKEELDKPLDVAEQALSTRPYLAGEAFSLADIVWMPYVYALFARSAGDLIESRQSLDAWWKRVSARPSWAKSERR